MNENINPFEGIKTKIIQSVRTEVITVERD